MRTIHQRMEEGLLFTDECEGLPEERLAAKQLMGEFNASDPADTKERVKLMANIFHVSEAEAGTFWIEPPFYFAYGSHISIGEGAYINVGCTFIDDGKLEIGKGLMCGPNVTIATVSHPINPTMREYMYTSPVMIGDDCWIGASVTICPGVTIGDGTTIGAGSVVTKDIPDHVVAVGNPCRVLRKVSEQDMTTYNYGHPIDPADLEEERQLRNS